ncbi:MAG TPA: dihydropteroate synthase [Solirubrobacteraceae bacterium]|nr:dihydropteroate synthase [Solirubrobacteraceae bacterium]
MAAAEDPVVMGIVNVTPDSFSDGGRYLDVSAAIAHGLELEADGAEILDVGGESTRPGAAPVSEAEELRRVVPVIAGLREAGARARISVDTSKAAVAAAALGAGASIVNDVTALRGDKAMVDVVAEHEAECCLMHMLGEPRTMQDNPHYDEVVADVKGFLEARMSFAVAHGVAEERILLDPGFGFGKTDVHNLELLVRLHELCDLGRPVLVGTSRKSFLGRLTGRPVQDRLAATIATNVIAYEHGARLFRVHDVSPIHDALVIAAATVRRRWARTTPTSTTTTT